MQSGKKLQCSCYCIDVIFSCLCKIVSLAQFSFLLEIYTMQQFFSCYSSLGISNYLNVVIYSWLFIWKNTESILHSFLKEKWSKFQIVIIFSKFFFFFFVNVWQKLMICANYVSILRIFYGAYVAVVQYFLYWGLDTNIWLNTSLLI